MRDPVDLLTCPECGAGLDHAQAACASCDFEPPDLTPQHDGLDAADLWDRRHATPVGDWIFYGLAAAAFLLLMVFGTEVVGMLLHVHRQILEVL